MAFLPARVTCRGTVLCELGSLHDDQLVEAALSAFAGLSSHLGLSNLQPGVRLSVEFREPGGWTEVLSIDVAHRPAGA